MRLYQLIERQELENLLAKVGFYKCKDPYDTRAYGDWIFSHPSMELLAALGLTTPEFTEEEGYRELWKASMQNWPRRFRDNVPQAVVRFPIYGPHPDADTCLVRQRVNVADHSMVVVRQRYVNVAGHSMVEMCTSPWFTRLNQRLIDQFGAL